MKRKTSKKERKRLFLITAMLMVLLVFFVSTIYQDWIKIIDKKSQIVALNQEYELLLEKEQQLNSEITKLQDENYLARYAKEKFMFSADGDTIIRMDD